MRRKTFIWHSICAGCGQNNKKQSLPKFTIYRASRKNWFFSTPCFGINPLRYFQNSFFSICAINLHLIYQNMSRLARSICSGEFCKNRSNFHRNVDKLDKNQIFMSKALFFIDFYPILSSCMLSTLKTSNKIHF